jgi:hypothetical protein
MTKKKIMKSKIWNLVSWFIMLIVMNILALHIAVAMAGSNIVKLTNYFGLGIITCFIIGLTIIEVVIFQIVGYFVKRNGGDW